MKKTVGLITGLLAIVLLAPGASLAERCCASQGQSGMMKDGQMQHKMHHGQGMCPMMVPGAKVEMKTVEDGAVITITAKDKEVIKAIQEKVKACQEHKATVDAEEVTCPVMGTKIKKSQAVETAEYKGQTYYFCCSGCKPAFMKDPEKYIK